LARYFSSQKSHFPDAEVSGYWIWRIEREIQTTSVVGDINMDLTMVKDGEADEHEWSELDCYEFFEQLKKIERRQKQQNPER
jgi:hypothetical protein